MWGGFGGTADGEEYLTDTWSYTSAGWDHLPAVSPPGYRACGAYDQARGVIVSFGGRTSTGPSAEIHEFDPESHTWIRCPAADPRPSPRFGAAMCDIPGSGVLVTGGYPGGHEAWIWNRKWSYLGITPESRCTHALVWDPLCTIAISAGGYVGTSTLRTASAWDLLSQSWTPGPELPEPRHLQAFAFIPGQGPILAGGRTTDGRIYDDVWMLQDPSGEWTPHLTAKFSPRFCSQMAWLPGYGLVMFGGEDGERLGDTIRLITDQPAAVNYWQLY